MASPEWGYWTEFGQGLISACLFGDGAGAAVIRNEPARIEWRDCESLIDPTTLRLDARPLDREAVAVQAEL